mgnify:CR=1 FL=1
MKKIITLIAALAITTAFFSCASTDKNDEVAAVKSESTTAPAENTVAEPILIDDFEYGIYWEAIGSSWNDGDQSMYCKSSTAWGTEGETSLECTVRTAGAEWEKSGFFTSPLETNWTGLTKISFDVYNPNDFDLSLTVVTQAGENWEAWNQIDAQIVPPGETTLEFDISSYQHLEFIQRVIIYQFGAVPQQCEFYIDNVQAY